MSTESRFSFGSALNFLVLLLLTGAAGVIWYAVPASKTTLENIDLEPLTPIGSPVHTSDVRGKVVLLNLWATWCGPCQAEFPHLVKLDHRWRSNPDFRMLSVSCGNDDLTKLRTDTLAFVRNEQADMPVYADPHKRTRSAIAAAVGFRGFPTTLVLDREGVIRGHWVGYHDGAEIEMENLIRELLDTPASPDPGKTAQLSR